VCAATGVKHRQNSNGTLHGIKGVYKCKGVKSRSWGVYTKVNQPYYRLTMMNTLFVVVVVVVVMKDEHCFGGALVASSPIR
jgi:hypothetical protein